VALFFKYNAYAFKQNANVPTFETLCLYDDESEIINSCIEFGFENIMEFEVLEQLISKDLRHVGDRRFLVGDVKKEEIKNNVEWQRWTRLFGSKDNELRSISVLPCSMKSDEDLLSRDKVRLGELRSILETRLVGLSRFPKTLSYLLHLSVVELRSDASSEYDMTSPEALRWFFVKKKFLKTLYDKLTDENWTTRNEIDSSEALDRFLTERAPFVKYETIEIETCDLAEYLPLVGDDDIEEEYYDVAEGEEEKEDEDERREAKKIRFSDLLMPSANERRRNAIELLYADRSENEMDDVPTDYDEEQDASLDARKQR
jgi:hypothetical protein